MIGLYAGPRQLTIYRDPQGGLPSFDNYRQAEAYIAARGLGKQASPLEITEDAGTDERQHQATDL